MKWRFACFPLALFASVFLHVVSTEAKNDYEIINTGIKGGGCWYDDSHFIVVKGHQPAPGQEFEVEGLYYLDPNKPKDLRRIDLSPIGPAMQRQIRDVSCQNETILFSIMAPDRKTSRLYSVKIGDQPELMADMRWARPSAISLKGQYVLGNKLTVDKGVWEEHSDCDVRHMKPGLKALCWPRDTIGQWVTRQFVVTEYLWRETILVRGADGKRERIQNPKRPLKLANGTELKQGYVLRDLENRIVQEIPTNQGLYQLINVSFKLDSRGKYLYAVCFKAGDHGERHFTVGGRICRFLLDGTNHDWEEVVSVQQSPRDPFSLHDLDVNAQGDVVMIERGHRPAISLWKYTAQSQRVEKLTHVVSPEDLGPLLLSPNGQWVSVKRNSQLVLIESKGAKP
jgi:hypothetical protein